MKREGYESQKAFAGEKGTIDAATLCGARQHRADDVYDDARKIGEKDVSRWPFFSPKTHVWVVFLMKIHIKLHQNALVRSLFCFSVFPLIYAFSLCFYVFFPCFARVFHKKVPVNVNVPVIFPIFAAK